MHERKVQCGCEEGIVREQNDLLVADDEEKGSTQINRGASVKMVEKQSEKYASRTGIMIRRKDHVVVEA